MEMAMWILFCLFASIGLVQCGVWCRDALLRRPPERLGCHVIPLYDDAEMLEPRVRRAISIACAEDGASEYVLLVDMGMEEECAQICDRLLEGTGGIYICGISELEDAIRRLDEL